MNGYILWLYFIPACLELITWGIFMSVRGVTPIRVVTALICSLTPGLNLASILRTAFRLVRTV